MFEKQWFSQTAQEGLCNDALLFEKEISYFFQCIKNKRVKHELDIFYAIKNLKFALKLFKK